MAQEDVNVNADSKNKDLEPERADGGKHLTSNQGVRVSDNQNQLKAGVRGPVLMEDFLFREKMTHFDHERIPERIVHARGSGAHGYFQVYKPLTQYTKAKVFADPSVKTPVFVRFSTVVGFRGSADTVRDVRGFATKFYTEDGNWDLVGNNMPVFFIQDAIKFPDLVHAIKPEPDNEMPQASAAHDNFWDFTSLMPESMHMIMWVLSDRALPRSYARMEGFGVHTFRLINDKGQSHFVKFHWKPVAGMASLVWDETQKIAGKDPDFNRRDLWDSIKEEIYPEFEMGMQIIPEADADKFDFDLLDATKLVPEELVPVQRVGKMVLNRNPDNFFAETEQVAFHPGHIVPGIDFSNDPLLQGRLFSYLDTQLIRLGGPNFAELPINRPLAPVHNNQRDGYMRQRIDKGPVNYEPNSRASGCPMQSPEAMRGFVSYMEQMQGQKVRERSPSFSDHFSQATLFWNSLTDPEKQRLVDAAHFELGKVALPGVKERMLDLFNKIDHDLAKRVAIGLGMPAPKSAEKPNHGKSSAALSLDKNKKPNCMGCQVAVLISEGFDHDEYMALDKALKAEKAKTHTISKFGGEVTAHNGEKVKVDKMHVTAASVMFDAVFVPGGKKSVQAMLNEGDALHFILEQFKHCKTIGATGDGVDLVAAAKLPEVELADGDKKNSVVNSHGVVTFRGGGPMQLAASVIGMSGSLHGAIDTFVNALKEMRHWDRKKEGVPA